MTKIINYWQRSSFWQRIEKASFYIGTTVTGTLVMGEASKTVTLISLASTIIGGLVGIFFNDENKDGIADIFQGNGHTVK